MKKVHDKKRFFCTTVPLAAMPDIVEVAGFIATGIILASLIAAVVGNSIRKMRTEDVIDPDEPEEQKA